MKYNILEQFLFFLFPQLSPSTVSRFSHKADGKMGRGYNWEELILKIRFQSADSRPHLPLGLAVRPHQLPRFSLPWRLGGRSTQAAGLGYLWVPWDLSKEKLAAPDAQAGVLNEEVAKCPLEKAAGCPDHSGVANTRPWTQHTVCSSWAPRIWHFPASSQLGWGHETEFWQMAC